MDALETALEEKKALYRRIKEVRTLAEQTRDSDERRRQTERLRILREMYRDACDQVERLRPPEQKHRKAPAGKIVQTGAVGFDFFERCSSVWSDLEGRTWNELEDIAAHGSARQAGELMQVLRSAMTALTDNQRECIMAYYAGRRSMPDIAGERGVSVSSVSRTIRRGLKRLEQYMIASLKARECLSENGFDFLGFAAATDVLTDRQREYLYFLLTDGVSMCEIARYLELEKSTMSRGGRRVEENLSAVSPGLPAAPAARKVDRTEWAGKPEKEIAAMLGISPAVYYRCVCRKETVCGLPRLAYEALRLRGLPAARAAERLGLTEGTVRKYWRKYEGADISAARPPEEYRPAARQRSRTDVRRLLGRSEGETIGDIVDAGTYWKMIAAAGEGG